MTFNEYVPSTGTIRIANTGHSLGCNDLNLYGRNVKETAHIYGVTAGAACLGESNPDLGRLEITHTGPNFGTSVTGATCSQTKGALYTCTATPIDSEGGTCSITTNRLCVENADCPTGETCQSSPAWTLTYTIKAN